MVVVEEEEEEEEEEEAGQDPRSATTEGLIIARQPTDEGNTEENGGPRGGAGRCQLPDGHGEEQVHAGRPCEQEDHSAGS